MSKKDLYISVFLALAVGLYAAFQRTKPYLNLAREMPHPLSPEPGLPDSLGRDSFEDGRANIGPVVSSSKGSPENPTSVNLFPSERSAKQIKSSFFGLSQMSSEEQRLTLLRFLGLPAQPPVRAMKISSRFGWRTDPLLGVRRHHSGIDIALPEGHPVHASGGGLITEIDYAEDYGLYVKIRHIGTSYTSRLSHLSDFASGLHTGQIVRRGETFAYSGSTGRSTGPHLHFEIRDEKGKAVDPYQVYEEYDDLRKLLSPFASNKRP